MMTRRNIKIAITIVLIIMMLATPLESAQASIWESLRGVWKGLQCSSALAIFDLSGCLQFALSSVATIIGTLVSLSASALNWVLGMSQALVAPDIVRESWVIFRNFVNMFFILVLIIMAFGTIFDIHNYTFKDLFPRFLTSALLINFSLEISMYVLRVANGLASVFLTTIGDVGSRLADGLMVTRIASPQGLGEHAANELQAIASGPGAVVTMLALIIFLIIIFATFLAATLFILARIVVIWFLLIVSPVAWFGYMLPTLKAETWSKWWKTFIGWSFFLPTYLFFIMFAAILLSAKKSVGITVGGYENTLQAGDYAKAFFQIIPLTDLLFFVLVIIVLLGGISISFKIGGFASTGGGAVMAGAQNFLKKIPIIPTKGTGGAREWRSVSDIGGGLKQIGTRMGKEGLPGWGKTFWSGTEGAERGEKAISQGLGRMLGYTSLQESTKAEQAAVAHEADAILNDPDKKLDDIKTELKDEKGKDLVNAFGQINIAKVAEYMALAKKGKLSKELLDYLTAAIGNRNPEIMKDIGKSLAETSFGGFKDEEVAAVLATSDKSNKSVRKEAQRWLSSEDGKRRMPDILSNPATATAVVNQGMEDLGKTTGEARGFLRTIGEKRAELAGTWKAENEEIKDDEGKLITDTTEKRVYATKKVIEDKTEREILSMSKETWADEGFKQALSQKLDDLLSRSPVGEYEGQFDPGEMAKFIQGMRSASKSVGDFQKKMDNFDALLNAPRTVKVKIRTETGETLEESVGNVREALNNIAAKRKTWESERYARQRSEYERREGGRGRPGPGGGLVDERGRPLRS